MKERRGEGQTMDGLQGEGIDEGENMLERTDIIDWALRTSNGWMDG